MRVHAFGEGAAALLVQWDEILPLSGMLLPQITDLVRERYKFQRSPNLSKMPDSLTAIFWEYGEHQNDDGPYAVKRFEFASGHLAVVCTTTENAEHFLADFMDFAKQKLAFREPLTPFGRQFTSVIVCDLDFDYAEAFSVWNNIIQMISEAFSEESTVRVKSWTPLSFRIGGVGGDGSALNGNPATLFAFERRVGSDPDDRKIFSRAPVRTKTHLQILEHIERQFGSKR